MSPADINPTPIAERIADRAVVADIEAWCPAFKLHDVTWIDVRPLLDERELSMQCIDMNTEALAYAEMRGLIARHPDHAHLVRITRHP